MGSIAATNGLAIPEEAYVTGEDVYYFRGDVNRDKKVDFDDLLQLSQNYGQTGRTYTQGNLDFSADGKVDFSDLLILAQHYGFSFAATPASTGAASKRNVGDTESIL